MNKKERIASLVISSFCVLVLALLIRIALKNGNVSTVISDASILDNNTSTIEDNSSEMFNLKTSKTTLVNKATAIIEGTRKKVTLPYNFNNLPKRTPVTILMTIKPDKGQYIYVRSVYSPIKIYANDELICEYGMDGTYPKFMQDPATLVDIIPLPYDDIVNIRMEYLSPSARDVLTVHPLVLGTEREILTSLFRQMGFPFLFSMIMLAIGMLLIIISCFITIFEKKGTVFLWLGLFALSSGCWGFCECNLTGLFIHNFTVLYIGAFAGLFMLPIPLMFFILTVITFKNKTPILLTGLIYEVTATVAFLLQLLGVLSLSKSMYVFHVFEPIYLSFFAISIFREWRKYNNKNAGTFLLPMVIIAVFSILEVVNYVVRLTQVLALFFQIGTLTFIFANSIIGGFYIKNGLRLKSEKQQLEFEVNLMEYRVEEQKKHYELLLQNAQQVREQRHDLRHQLAVLKGLNENGSNQKLTEYLDSLVTQIPTEKSINYCENIAVNAIVSHYANIAQNSNIDFSFNLVVPESNKHNTDSNLCMIFGNLLENAIEACNRMTDGNKFIKINSYLQYDTLTITMDNSFDGKFNCENGKYRSSKRDSYGIGLSSVLSIAEKHGGNALFETDSNVFKSSVYVRI